MGKNRVTGNMASAQQFLKEICAPNPRRRVIIFRERGNLFRMAHQYIRQVFAVLEQRERSPHGPRISQYLSVTFGACERGTEKAEEILARVGRQLVQSRGLVNLWRIDRQAFQ